jgi:hypothetical protein
MDDGRLLGALPRSIHATPPGLIEAVLKLLMEID